MAFARNIQSTFPIRSALYENVDEALDMYNNYQELNGELSDHNLESFLYQYELKSFPLKENVFRKYFKSFHRFIFDK